MNRSFILMSRVDTNVNKKNAENQQSKQNATTQFNITNTEISVQLNELIHDMADHHRLDQNITQNTIQNVQNKLATHIEHDNNAR
mmetsp:Transcript_30489/g.48900  ORF Transcript_30489/g.48900 Transcript_30489/m.48900 type:complete len:85 (-) Transcript_30489:94-348(-)